MKKEFVGKIDWHFYRWNDDAGRPRIGDENFNDIFESLKDKRIRLTIEVLPDEIGFKDDSVKIQVKLRTIVQNSTALCNALRINPYCINEGADGDEYISVPITIAKEYGLI